MSAFKRGDRVRVVDEQPVYGLVHGADHTVESMERGYVKVEGLSSVFYSHRFELVDDVLPARPISPADLRAYADLIQARADALRSTADLLEGTFQ